MTEDLTRNKLSTPNLTRSERLAFMEGVCWATAHMYEAARVVEPDKREIVTVEGKPPTEVITKAGQPAFAHKLRQLAAVLEVEGSIASKKRFPDFEPLTAPMKRGESSGL